MEDENTYFFYCISCSTIEGRKGNILMFGGEYESSDKYMQYLQAYKKSAILLAMCVYIICIYMYL